MIKTDAARYERDNSSHPSMCSVNWRWSFRENGMQDWNHIDSYNKHYQIRDIHLDLQGIHSTHSSKNAEKSHDSPTKSDFLAIVAGLIAYRVDSSASLFKK
ncbi:hypothetical protein AT3G06436 [Arabidopsis thaliana]|uniref:Uncharacterized protein n=1 Tax=Arabidopsis thaliana TaxID=3702 RepID=A0A1I9LQ30_ARATH|nr:uncharacterized protein AT3G06436 [Arabidopsis thaliana]ANM64688.1 hypothetical protein AT3G06436 [Arabidopsis thaliana]|eukprot:NP_001326700.1 hypothetical protein AT3G06436 [Arabidopsis thaliana]